MARSPDKAPVPPPQLTHRQLVMFRAIMLHSHLGRAAAATGSSQPTLSRELARLEQLLDFALFDRVGGDWERFYAEVKRLGALPKAERRLELAETNKTISP